jgi:hypothetical protein
LEVRGQLHVPAALPPGTHWIGGWVGPRVGLGAVEKNKIFHSWESNPSHPAHSPSLYQLIYPGSIINTHAIHYVNLNYDLCGHTSKVQIYFPIALVHKYNDSTKCEVKNL